MPTKAREENTFIARFLSAYEDYSWSDAHVDWLDERIDGAVEALATRKSDGKTLAIEHTVIEPFVGDKEDFAFFENAFLQIERDPALPVPGQWIRVFIPVGTLRGQRKKAMRDAMVKTVHEWLSMNRLSLPDGFSEHHCAIVGISGTGPSQISLYIRVVPIGGAGKVHVRRQQVEDNLDEVIKKALTKKLPKLVGTSADRRILLLERQHMNLYPSRMLEEIEKRRNHFPELGGINEIWILETMFYEKESYLRFERFDNGVLVSSLDFLGTELFDKLEHGNATLGPAATRG